MNLKKWVLVNFALLLPVAVSALQLSAQTQTTGEITGVVTDQSGAAVPNAKITLKDDAKGTTTTTETNKDGVYHFQLLIPSNYTVSATSSGFQEVKRTVNVALGVVTSADIQLTIGSASVTVTVEAQNQPLLQTENGNVATTFNQQQLSETPTPGNDLTAIVQTAPGVVMNTAGGLGNFSDHGVGAASNLFTLNGMDDNDPFLNLNSSGATNLLLGANEIQESTIVSSGYSAEFGSLAGANVSYVTKSGGNNFHGNAVYYWNGSALNANDWFLNNAGDPKNFSNANQWAASIWGTNQEGQAVLLFQHRRSAGDHSGEHRSRLSQPSVSDGNHCKFGKQRWFRRQFANRKLLSEHIQSIQQRQGSSECRARRWPFVSRPARMQRLHRPGTRGCLLLVLSGGR